MSLNNRLLEVMGKLTTSPVKLAKYSTEVLSRLAVLGSYLLTAVFSSTLDF